MSVSLPRSAHELDELHPACHAQLAIDVGEVAAGRTIGDGQVVAHLAHAHPRAGETRHLELPFGEKREVGRGTSHLTLPGNVYAIDEDSQWEEIISYLIIGEDRAILLDTGMGISSIKADVDELTDLPVTVVLSHTHHDHMGGMHEFDDLLVYDSDYAIERATTGMDEFGDISYEVAAEDGVFNPDRELPEGFSPEGFHVIGMAPTGTLADGDTIDLGGRTLQVMYTPGHNETAHGVEILSSAADDFDAILDGSVTEYEIGEDGYRYYEFEDGVVIITEDVDFAETANAA